MTTAAPATARQRDKLKRFLVRFALVVLVIELALSIVLVLVGVKYADFQ